MNEVPTVRVFAADEAAALVLLLSLAAPWHPAPINSGNIVERDVRDAEILAQDAQPALVQRVHDALATAVGELAAQLAPRTVLSEVQIVRYHPGGRYVDHRDSPSPGATSRALSVVCYLNDEFAGGATVFPDDDVVVQPQSGIAIVFAPERLHRADPVLSGTKYAVTAWYHAR